jgi:hypothetical protein
MPFERRWSDELKRAVVATVLDHGLSVPRAVELARAGELPGIGHGVPAAPGLPVATVRDYVTDERRRRKLEEAGRAAPEEVVGRSLGVLTAILEREVDRAAAQARKGKVSPDHIVKLARAGAEVAKLARLTSGGKAPSSPDKGTKGSGEAQDFIGGLAQR